ncbi:MAG TPA: terminase small subunit [Stellaceae bacterium]|nr:terminase small subunit [Stellaceae bacterium]
MGAKPTKLSARQKRFVEEYLVDLNGKRAAIRAGFSENKADSCGARLLRNRLVGPAVKKAMENRARRTRITADRVLREYARIAFADIRRVTNWDEKLGLVAKASNEMSDDDAAAIAEVRADANSKTLRVRLHDKKRALDAIARHLGLFSRHQPTAPESPAVLAERVRELIRSRLADHARPDEDE